MAQIGLSTQLLLILSIPEAVYELKMPNMTGLSHANIDTADSGNPWTSLQNIPIVTPIGLTHLLPIMATPEAAHGRCQVWHKLVLQLFPIP